MSANELSTGAKAIEMGVVQTGKKHGINVKPVSWVPPLPTLDATVAESYALKLKIEGRDEIFEAIYGREPMEDSAHGHISERAEEITTAAVASIKNKLS